MVDGWLLWAMCEHTCAWASPTAFLFEGYFAAPSGTILNELIWGPFKVTAPPAK
jgi:hypothetical protein